MKNYIKIPMIAAIVLEAFALLIAFGMYMNQDQIINSIGRNLDIGKIYPAAITLYIITFAVYIIFFLVMITYDGASCRWVGDAMVIVWIIFSTASPYVSVIQNRAIAIRGSDYVAAMSILTSQISMFVSPLSIIAAALALVAIGRFSARNECREAVPMGVDPAVFGQGYMPAQGYTPVQESVPGRNHEQGQ